MPTNALSRRTTVIMNIDAVGFCRSMARNERMTIQVLFRGLKLIKRCVRSWNGRIVDAPGDNVLAEFATSTAAAHCALELQQQLADCNAELPDPDKMAFRIGLHRGTVFDRGGSLYGHAINVTARIQSAAPSGGIVISEIVASDLGPDLSATARELGPRHFRNLPSAIPILELPIETAEYPRASGVDLS